MFFIYTLLCVASSFSIYCYTFIERSMIEQMRVDFGFLLVYRFFFFEISLYFILFYFFKANVWDTHNGMIKMCIKDDLWYSIISSFIKLYFIFAFCGKKINRFLMFIVNDYTFCSWYLLMMIIMMTMMIIIVIIPKE